MRRWSIFPGWRVDQDGALSFPRRLQLQSAHTCLDHTVGPIDRQDPFREKALEIELLRENEVATRRNAQHVLAEDVAQYLVHRLAALGDGLYAAGRRHVDDRRFLGRPRGPALELSLLELGPVTRQILKVERNLDAAVGVAVDDLCKERLSRAVALAKPRAHGAAEAL